MSAMRRTTILGAAMIAGALPCSPALALHPQIDSVTPTCVFDGTDPQPVTVLVKLVAAGTSTFVFRNAAGQETTSQHFLHPGQTGSFRLPAGTYLLKVKSTTHPHMYGAAPGIVVRPFRMEMVNGQRKCAEMPGTVQPGRN